MVLNLFQEIFKAFREKPVKELPVRFELYQKEEDRHVVRIFLKIGDNWEKIKDPSKLFEYGYTLNHEGVTYILNSDIYQVLFSLRSLNPKVLENGDLEFEITPPILAYLREKGVKEDSNSKRLKISKEALQTGVKIDYFPDKGIIVETGYKTNEDRELIPSSKLKKTRDGNYVKIGNCFYPLPLEPNEKVKDLLLKEKIQIPIEKVPEFFQKDFVFLKSNFKVVLITERANSIEIVDEPFQPTIHIDSGEKGWLEFNVEYKVGDYILPHHILKKHNSNYYQVNQNTWIKIDKEKLSETENELQEMEVKKEGEKYKLPLYQFNSLQEFAEEIGGEKEISEKFQEFLDNLVAFRENEKFDVGERIINDLKKEKIELRSYQKAGIHWLNWLRKNYLHGILADEMGLGKTIQVLITLRLAYDDEKVKLHSLVLCPKPVMEFWKKESKRCFPQLPIYIYHGPYRERRIWYHPKPHLIITTYATAREDQEIIRKVPLFFLILDEATMIKNPRASRTRAVKTFNALHRVAITGTPVENRPLELWSLFDFLMKGHLGKYEKFRIDFEEPIIAGDKKAKEKLVKRISPFIRRKLKKEVIEELPKKIEKKEWCELTEEQKALYGQIIEKYRYIREALIRGEKVDYTTSILPVLLRLKQVCDHPALITEKEKPLKGRSEKFDRFWEKIENIVEAGQQAVLFSQYLKSLDLFEKLLKEKGIPFGRLDGATLQPQSIIDRFNEGKDKIILCSLRASSYGINLKAAGHVLHFDRWWNPAVEDQATDRAHRIGQKNDMLYIHYVLVKETLEEKIDKLLESKRKLADEIIGAPIIGKRDFTREELIEILKPLN